jgi:hypoxanthine phosphoribosyltransferase
VFDIILNGLKWLFAILGGIVTLLTIWDRLRRWRNKQTSWKQIIQATRVIIRKIKHKGLLPEVVVGVRRSGSICGAILAGNLGGLPFYSLNPDLDWESSSTGAHIMSGRIHDGSAYPMIKGKRILVVTCFNVTGVSPKESIEYLKQFHPKSMTLVAFYESAYSQIKADIIAKKISEGSAEKVLCGMPWMFADEYRHPHFSSDTQVDA